MSAKDQDHTLLPTPALGPLHAFPSLHDLSPRISTVRWFWPNWIPRGMLTLLGAAPGVGKSLVALDLARRVIHDQPFPDGAPVPCPGRCVLIVDAEGVPALLKQRAQAWDIDTRRLYLMLGQGPGNHIDLADTRQQILLMNMIAQLEPGLVIVDSLAAATSRAETSLQGARDILGFLATVARKGRLPFLIIHHLRKPKRSASAARPAASFPIVAGDLRGSSHISAAARSVLALSLVPRPPTAPAPIQMDAAQPSPAEDESPIHELCPAYPRAVRRLIVIKTNLCRIPPPLGLVFEGDDQAVPTLRYADLDELLPQAGYQSSPLPTQLDRCARWLLQFLADAGQPLKPALVVRAAAAQGFTRATLYRARQALATAIVDLGSSPRDPRKRWALPNTLVDEGHRPGGTPPGQ